MAAPNKPEDHKKQDIQNAEEQIGRTAPGETTASEQEGANQLQEDLTAGKVFGDTTSSAGGANQPGYHGRDGGVAAGTTNNPAAQEDAIEEETDEAEAEQEQAPTKL